MVVPLSVAASASLLGSSVASATVITVAFLFVRFMISASMGQVAFLWAPMARWHLLSEGAAHLLRFISARHYRSPYLIDYYD